MLGHDVELVGTHSPDEPRDVSEVISQFGLAINFRSFEAEISRAIATDHPCLLGDALDRGAVSAMRFARLAMRIEEEEQ